MVRDNYAHSHDTVCHFAMDEDSRGRAWPPPSSSGQGQVESVYAQRHRSCMILENQVVVASHLSPGLWACLDIPILDLVDQGPNVLDVDLDCAPVLQEHPRLLEIPNAGRGPGENDCPRL